MNIVRFELTPLSAFGTPLRGDTLFGQLCWAIRLRFGVARLSELLDGYTHARPFAVASDAFPAGHVPRPTLPLSWLGEIDPKNRKAVKRRTWLPLRSLDEPERWIRDICEIKSWDEHPQPHNSISRTTGTTGRGDFAPYQMAQGWYPQGATLDCYIAFDPQRIDQDTLALALSDIGASGFGRDASIGLGRFKLRKDTGDLPPSATGANAYLCLAPCVPQTGEWRPEACFYQPFTRFGRHGGMAAVKSGRPFKTPILMVDTGAVLTPRSFTAVSFVGRGLGGDGSLSKSIPETVHQGYAPVLPICLPARRLAQ
jgi:CRISPR-associated protein Csm4